ncbi:hypothetical protein QJS04_geneDACA024883 [Acorus gramineus]|uniref:5MP1/2-like HEAT domain-containing protein n=1 Tax=Acorus gramineus TaxID=55184 RepID=A0AAV9B9J9_ACOGR|nr:hypothetical protein QJS04_geneDACA024883 [Acorus gramineus]
MKEFFKIKEYIGRTLGLRSHRCFAIGGQNDTLWRTKLPKGYRELLNLMKGETSWGSSHPPKLRRKRTGASELAAADQFQKGVVFTGGRTQPGTTKPEEGDRHPYSILDYEPTREVILPFVLYIQKILRRRPFLIKNLENVMRRFLQSLELFEDNERKKLAIFTALTFSQKLSGLPPETVFQPLLKGNLVAKGLVLSFMTDFFKVYLVDNNLDDLIALLKRGKMEDNLLEFFPSANALLKVSLSISHMNGCLNIRKAMGTDIGD